MAEINLKRNIMVSGVSRAAIMVLLFLTSWLSTRYLGVSLKGEYSYLTTLAGFIWLVLDLGIHKTYPWLLRKYPEKESSVFYWSYLLFAADVLLLGGFGMLFLPQWSRLISYPLDTGMLWIFVGLVTLPQLFHHLQMIYLGQDRVGTNSVYQFGNSFLMLILVALAFVFIRDVDRLRYILLSGNLVMLIIIIAYSVGFLRRTKSRSFEPRFMLKSYGMGFRVFLSSLFITMLLKVDVVLLKRMLDFEAVGIYSLAAHLVDILQLASNVVGSLLLVKLTDSASDVERWILMKKLFILFFGFLAIANLGFVLVGKPLIVLIYGEGFRGTYNAYLWLIPASFGLSFGSLFNTYLWSKGFPLISVILPFCALLLNVVLNLLLIPLMGIAGAGLASSIAYMIWFGLIVLYEQKLSGGRMLGHLKPCKQDIVDLSDMVLKELRIKN